MRLAEKIAEKAKELIQGDAVIISAANFENKLLSKIQVYFYDENSSAMDIIKRIDLLEAAPENIYVINTNAQNEKSLLQEIFVVEIDEQLYFKRDITDENPCDDIGNIPDVAYLEAIELISNIKFDNDKR